MRNAAQFLGLFFILNFPVFFFQGNKFHFEAPSARSGDEPHYLVLLHSIVLDGDLEVANNYNTNSFSQGRYLSAVLLDHHSLFVCKTKACKRHKAFTINNGTKQSDALAFEKSKKGCQKAILWNELFQLLPDKASGHYFKIAPRGGLPDLSGCKEYGWHPPGYPALLALFLYYPVSQGFAYYESFIVLLQMFLYALALLYLGRLFGIKFWKLAALALVLPIWYYNASFYTEGLSASLLLAAVLAWYGRRLWLTGLCLGLLVFIKESYLLMPPLFIFAEGLFYGLSRRLFLRLLSLLAYPVLSTFVLLAKSYWIYGEFFHTYLPWQSSDTFFQNTFYSLFGRADGIFVYSPVLLFSLLGLFQMRFSHRPLALLIAAVFLAQFGMVNASVHWSGGPSYANRLLVPVLAPLLVPLAVYWKGLSFPFLRKRFRLLSLLLFYVLFAWSFANSFSASTHLRTAWGRLS